MSAIATEIVEKYNLTPKMDVWNLSPYAPKFLQLLTDNRKRNQARRRLRDGFRFSSEQVNVLIPTQKGGRHKVVNVTTHIPKVPEETIGEIAQRFLRNNLSTNDIRAEARNLGKSASNASAGSSRLSRLRRELRNLNAPREIIEATKIPDITEESNEIQKNRRRYVEAFEKIDYPDRFTLESVKERLDGYDVRTQPSSQALADIMIMLCIRPAELTSLRITGDGVTGYAKNRGQPDIPRKFRSLEKNRERANELLTWIQNAISSGSLRNPGIPGTKWFNRYLKNYGLIPRYLRKMGAVYAIVAHNANNLGHSMTIAQEALRHNPDNHTSPTQNYVVVNYRPRNVPPEQARPFRVYDE